MKDFLEKIVAAIVDDSKTVEILEKPEGELTVLTIIAPGKEVGKIIGKGGRVINAIRTLCRLKGGKNLSRFLIRVEAKAS